MLHFRNYARRLVSIVLTVLVSIISTGLPGDSSGHPTPVILAGKTNYLALAAQNFDSILGAWEGTWTRLVSNDAPVAFVSISNVGGDRASKVAPIVKTKG